MPGVAEVASLGGFVKQYQVAVDPNVLVAYKLSITDVADAIRKSNSEVGGRLLEISGAHEVESRFRERSWAGDPRTVLSLEWVL